METFKLITYILSILFYITCLITFLITQDMFLGTLSIIIFLQTRDLEEEIKN